MNEDRGRKRKSPSEQSTSSNQQLANACHQSSHNCFNANNNPCQLAHEISRIDTNIHEKFVRLINMDVLDSDTKNQVKIGIYQYLTNMESIYANSFKNSALLALIESHFNKTNEIKKKLKTVQETIRAADSKIKEAESEKNEAQAIIRAADSKIEESVSDKSAAEREEYSAYKQIVAAEEDLSQEIKKLISKN